MNVLALCPDLFFSVRISSALTQAGHTVRTIERADELADALAAEPAALAIVDIGAAGDWPWPTLIETLHRSDPALPILCFGSHTDVEAIRTAKSLGATRVVARSEFVSKLVTLVERYAVGTEG